VDGWGELKTPLGTYSTLRVVSTVDITDTLYSEKDAIGLKIKRPTRCEFKWLANGSGIPVLQMDAIKVNGQVLQVYSVTYMDTLRPDVIHVNIAGSQNETLAIQVYPNPATEQFTFEYVVNHSAPVKITVTNILGKELMIVSDQTEMEGVKKQTIDVKSLPAGIYFINIQIGNEHHVSKVSVIH
jgi:hypothetical protein